MLSSFWNIFLHLSEPSSFFSSSRECWSRIVEYLIYFFQASWACLKARTSLPSFCKYIYILFLSFFFNNSQAFYFFQSPCFPFFYPIFFFLLHPPFFLVSTVIDSSRWRLLLMFFFFFFIFCKGLGELKPTHGGFFSFCFCNLQVTIVSSL